ncbi:MAG: TIGR00730 family Rossman fold protein [Gemmatimonadaceae bacterium]|nr:TIGR00730 family Rossman fold protein [Gemmatimonadaceae bacterium]
MLHTVCVFCAASPGANPVYAEAAREMGRFLASSGRRVVYGGGRTGLMGALAEGALAAGGEVIGIMPKHLVDREVAHTGLTELHVVASMHERKALLAELSDGFLAMPGGLGTLEELFEIWTWGQLGLHRKPYGLLNVAGYFDRLLDFLDHAVGEQFLREEYRALLVVESAPAALLERMEAARPPELPRWVDREST